MYLLYILTLSFSAALSCSHSYRDDKIWFSSHTFSAATSHARGERDIRVSELGMVGIIWVSKAPVAG